MLPESALEFVSPVAAEVANGFDELSPTVPALKLKPDPAAKVLEVIRKVA
jgi:hypothetical protein